MKKLGLFLLAMASFVICIVAAICFAASLKKQFDPDVVVAATGMIVLGALFLVSGISVIRSGPEKAPAKK